MSRFMEEHGTSNISEKQGKHTVLSLLVPFFRRNGKTLCIGLFFMVVVDSLQLLVPQIIKSSIDSLRISSTTTQTLLYQGGMILAIGFGMAVLRYLWRIMLMTAARDMERGLREQLFHHLLYMDARYYDTTQAGDIMAHATSDINHVRMAFGIGIIVLIDTSIIGITALGIMLYTQPKLALLAMLPMPLLIYLTQYLGKRTHALHTTAQEAFSVLTEQIRECFFGIRIIRVYNFTRAANQRVEDGARDYYGKNLKRAIVMSLMNPLMGFFFNLSTLIIIVYGGFLVMEKVLTPGELVAFLQYLGLLSWPIISIGWMINLYQRGMSSLIRIGRILEERPGIRVPASSEQRKNSSRCFPLQGRITFEHGWFSAGNDVQDSPPILSDITLDIPAGKRIGITGPPGSGKTSLLRLIPRIHDLEKGRLLLDGQDIQSFDPHGLRSQMGFMPQEPFLFSETIRDNILMGRDISPEELEEVLNICELSETIARMPKGLDTMTGERGIALSGGQKQRISLARALLGRPSILLLDDPISQLDTRTANKILSRLTEFLEKKSSCCTLIITSHRISAIAQCDMILVMEKGNIIARGTHRELLVENTFYQNTFSAQQFEDSLEENGQSGQGQEEGIGHDN